MVSRAGFTPASVERPCVSNVSGSPSGDYQRALRFAGLTRLPAPSEPARRFFPGSAPSTAAAALEPNCLTHQLKASRRGRTLNRRRPNPGAPVFGELDCGTGTRKLPRAAVVSSSMNFRCTLLTFGTVEPVAAMDRNLRAVDRRRERQLLGAQFGTAKDRDGSAAIFGSQRLQSLEPQGDGTGTFAR